MTTTRTISVMPYLGGTQVTSYNQNTMVRLTPTRMVWFYSQTSPNWNVGTIIDTPTGWINGGTPTVTTQQLLEQGSFVNAYVNAVRLNDNTVMLISSSNGTSFFYRVYTIDSNNQFNLVASSNAQTVAASLVGAKAPSSSTYATGYNVICYAEVGDNVVVANANAAGGNALYFKIAFNTSTNAVTFDSNWSVGGTLIGTNNTNIVARKIPGTTMTLVTYKLIGSIGAWYNSTGYNAMVLNADGSVQMTIAQMPAATDGSFDLIPLPGNRLVASTSNTAVFYSIDYNAKTYNVISQAQFTTAWSVGTSGYTMLPLTADYYLLLNKSAMFTPGANLLRCKVVRRVDFNIIEQSAASSGNTNQGFTITGTPATYMNTYTNEPEIINGKIFYWGWTGASSGSNVGNLSWTIVTLPTS